MKYLVLADKDLNVCVAEFEGGKARTVARCPCWADALRIAAALRDRQREVAA